MAYVLVTCQGINEIAIKYNQNYILIYKIYNCVIVTTGMSSSCLLSYPSQVPGSRCYPNRIGPIDMESWDGETFVKPLRHPETPIYPKLHTGEPPPKGRIYDKKPFKMQVEAGKTYKWCSCGVSKTQVMCWPILNTFR